jgi:predicted dehydrogenase
MERRNFIQKTGLLTAGALLHNQLMNLYAASNADSVIGIGIIGSGDRGRGLASTLNSMPDKFSIKAVCDILAFRLDEMKKEDKQNNFKYHNDYRKLLDDKSITAVIISTPLHNHFEIAAEALKAGKHVYLEKAMTYNADQSIELSKLCAKHSRQVLQVGHQYRYTPLYFKVKEMIDKDYLGKVVNVEARWDRNWNWRRPVPAGYTDKQVNWRMYKEYSGGLPAELLSHQVDFINWVFNTHPDEVLGTGGIDYYKDGRETFDNVQAVLRYNKDGMIGNFGATCGNAKEGYIFKLKGTKGTIELLMNDGVFYPESTTKKDLQTTVDGVAGATKIEWNKDGGIPITKEKLKDGSWYALQEFYKSITENIKPVSNVITGGRTAICVHMMNVAIFNHGIEKWKPEYNIG